MGCEEWERKRVDIVDIEMHEKRPKQSESTFSIRSALSSDASAGISRMY